MKLLFPERLRSIALVLVVACVDLLPAAVNAQTPPVLVVTVRDANGQGLGGLTVLVRDPQATVVFARENTDVDGRATIPTLPTTEVRVLVQGVTPAGVTLRFAGADATGIPILLSMPPNHLDLLVDLDGTLRLTPAMLAIEPGVPIALIPTALPARPVTQTPLATLPPTSQPEVRPQPAPEETAWPWLAVLGLLLFVMIGLVLALVAIARGKTHD